jgi:transposase-like protein
MAETIDCPRCGSRQVDEYTHSDCPPGSTSDDHRHWVCANAACEYEWIEQVPTEAKAVTPSAPEVSD